MVHLTRTRRLWIRRLTKLIVVTLAAATLIAPARAASAAPVNLSLPVVTSESDGALHVFAVGSDTGIWHNSQWFANGWREWTSLGAPNYGVAPGRPAAALNADGRLEVFTRAAGSYYHKWELYPDGPWSSWYSLGSPNADTGAISVANNADGRLELFVSDGRELWHTWQTTPNGIWGGWYSLGHPSTGYVANGAPAVERNIDGRLDVFAVNSFTKFVNHLHQMTPNGGWSEWAGVGSLETTPPPMASIGVTINSDGRLELFGIADGANYQGTLWHTWQVNPAQYWGGWYRLGNVGQLHTYSDVGATRNQDGRLEVFAATWSLPCCGMVLQWQTSPGGSWGSPSGLGGYDFGIYFSVGKNLDGRLELFSDKNGIVYHAWQQAPGQGWTAFYPLT